MKTALTIAFVLAAACGGKSKPAATAEKHEGQGMEHEKMTPELTKFHDVLAPRWHAEKGDKRMKDTCAAIPEFQTNAAAVAKATPPTGADATAWTTKAKELTDAVVALDGTCKANDATAFEPAFARVHNGFHAVLELSMSGAHHEGMEHEGMEHEEHEEHEGHEGHEGMEHGEHKM